MEASIWLLLLCCVSIHSTLSVGTSFITYVREACPQFQNVSSLDYESCQFAKTPSHLGRPKVNKRVGSAFELVHSDVRGPCLVASKTGHKYFVTFVNDFSRVTLDLFYEELLKSKLNTVFRYVC